MPSDFIPMAEKTALINRITAWVIDNGIAQAARWQQQGLDFNLALNVSAADLDRPGFAGLLRRGLDRHKLDPRRLEIEFTESAMIRHPDHLAEQLAAIAALGVHIAIDDFGTGYSNFSYLKQLPASSLKIDQSFIRSLPDSQTDRTLVPAMIQLGHSLGQRVVAEGIESAEAYAQLRAWAATKARATGSPNRCRPPRWKPGWKRRGTSNMPRRSTCLPPAWPRRASRRSQQTNRFHHSVARAVRERHLPRVHSGSCGPSKPA